MKPSAIRVVRSLQCDYGIGDDTIIAIMVDYIDHRCDMEDFENYMLDRADPEEDGGEDEDNEVV